MLRKSSHMAPPTCERPEAKKRGCGVVLGFLVAQPPGEAVSTCVTLLPSGHCAGRGDLAPLVLSTSGFSRAVNECQPSPAPLQELRRRQLLVINVCVSHSEYV